MLSTTLLAAATALLSLIGSGEAAFNAAARTNLALYYGQGPNEGTLGLEPFCREPNGPDIIPLAFINRYLAQGNGYPGSNFGSSCGANVFTGPGYNNVNNNANNFLLTTCPAISSAITVCQSLGKKILLSLGGSTSTYRLTSDADGYNMAEFLWGAFGPANATWTKLNLPRPFDYNGQVNVVDGFDFDIEHVVSGEQAYYITMINRLQARFAEAKNANAASKTYLITAAPQCVVPDSNMGTMILGAKFDMIFVQFYNTAACSARTWVSGNPNYATTQKEVSTGFSFNSWVSAITAPGSKSGGAKIFIGVLGSPSATTTSSTFYLSSTELKSLAEAYYCHPSFGGVMIWEAIYAENNKLSNIPFQEQVKSLLTGLATGTGAINCAQTTTSGPSSTPTCATNACVSQYTVVSGDTCFGIATEYGLTLAQFTALNPAWTAATCPTLQIGDVVCVKQQAACIKARRTVAEAMEGEVQAREVVLPKPMRGNKGHLRRHAHTHGRRGAVHNHKH